MNYTWKKQRLGLFLAIAGFQKFLPSYVAMNQDVLGPTIVSRFQEMSQGLTQSSCMPRKNMFVTNLQIVVCLLHEPLPPEVT